MDTDFFAILSPNDPVNQYNKLYRFHSMHFRSIHTRNSEEAVHQIKCKNCTACEQNNQTDARFK